VKQGKRKLFLSCLKKNKFIEKELSFIPRPVEEKAFAKRWKRAFQDWYYIDGWEEGTFV